MNKIVFFIIITVSVFTGFLRSYGADFIDISRMEFQCSASTPPRISRPLANHFHERLSWWEFRASGYLSDLSMSIAGVFRDHNDFDGTNISHHESIDMQDGPKFYSSTQLRDRMTYTYSFQGKWKVVYRLIDRKWKKGSNYLEFYISAKNGWGPWISASGSCIGVGPESNFTDANADFLKRTHNWDKP